MTTPERLRIAAEQSDFGLRELMAVREIAHAFLNASRPEEVYQFALDRVCPLIGASFACVYVIEDGTDLMRLAAVHNWPQKYASFLSQMRVRLGFGPSGEAASERRTIEVLDVFADPTLEDWQEVAQELGFRAFVALPLGTTAGVLGAVTFYFQSPNLVGSETRHLVRLVADQMAATAEKAQLISSLKQANAELTTTNGELQCQFADVVEARRIKDDFLANISHELRTPLTAVMGYIALMQEGAAGPITDEQHQTLDQVKDASDQLLSLIVDLLELTALKREEMETTIADVDPREPLRDAVRETKNRREGVLFEVIVPDIVPSMRCDRRTVTRAIKALLHNANKFTKVGTVTASLEVDGDRVRYVVSDTGIGIPPEVHGAVFDEFRQVDSSMTREFGGAGLGLALAGRLARAAHGKITLESAPGSGSTFTLDVPLQHTTEES
ncbi:MAG: GAF domain-containing sensor histidine kinase [Gemmatimonadaceae bacterium]